ncbi:MAG: hypothetical protein AB7Q37_07905 [Pyrinomonadaceae bacterium]
MKRAAATLFLALFLISAASAQRPEITLTLNEAFFDSMLNALFDNAVPMEISIAENSGESSRGDTDSRTFSFGFAERNEKGAACREVIQLVRESNGVRSAVRFREGKILAPLAFTGNYDAPFIGCVPFAGHAQTAIDLEFDQPNQRVIARARVMNVSLNGTGGVGGGLIARMIQGSIDKKINPMELVQLEKLSFMLPVQKDTNIKMKASGVRHEVVNGAVNIHIAYEFIKV